MVESKPKTILKIGLVFDDSLDKPDGVQQYVISLGQWLSHQGHDVHYLVGQTKRQDLPNIHSLSRNIDVRFNGNRMSMPLPTSKKMLKSFLDKEQFDIFHVQMPYSPFLAHRLIMAAGPKVAVIGTFHIFAESKLVITATKFLSVWLRSSLNRFDKMVSVSEAARQFCLQNFGVDTNILPNAIDYQRFATAQPRQEYTDGLINVMFLGRLVPRKGCHLLLEAINLIKNDDLPKFRLIICGKGPLLDSLKTYASNNRLDQVVEFVGFVSEEDKPSFYASADIAVFPSIGGESFGIVLLEAMCSGRAVVLAGNNAGYQSVMYRNQDLLFDAGSVEAIADVLRQYLRDKNLRTIAQQWGQEYAKSFDISLIGNHLTEIYQEALRKRLGQ